MNLKRQFLGISFLTFLSTFGACHMPQQEPSAMGNSANSRYPAHWWAPVSKEGAPDWEILPQEAGPGEVILSKRHELGLLSNFAPTPFVFRGRRYASIEGFWQMMLTPRTRMILGPNIPV